MKNTNKKEWKDLSKVEKVVGLTAVGIVLFFGSAIVIGIISGISDTLDSSGNKQPKTTKVAAPEAEKKVESQPKPPEPISEGDAEKYCQDAGLLGKYIDLGQVSIISISNYNVQYFDTGNKDSAGRTIMMLTWNGKHNGDKILFQCQVSGTKEDTQLHLLSMGGIELYKAPGN